MPLELFNHEKLAISREIFWFAVGVLRTDSGAQLLRTACISSTHQSHARLFTSSILPTQFIPVSLPGVRYIPLVYGFQYLSNGEDFIYRVINECEIEVLAPEELRLSNEYPYSNYPSQFEEASVAFDRVDYDPTRAEDAFNYQGIFGLEQLSPQQMKRVVELAKSAWRPSDFDRSESNQHWSDEELVQIEGCEPFVQGAPSDSCENLNCTAETDYVTDATEIQFPPETCGGCGGPIHSRSVQAWCESRR